MSRKKEPASESETATPPMDIRRDKGRIWSHLRQKWIEETPEETVRQMFLWHLVNNYGYSIDQMDEEANVTGRGAAHARADFVIWRTPQDRSDNKNPLIVVECKSDNVTIRREDYGQGDNYARLTGARFFVTHNSKETKYWRVLHDKMPKSIEEIENIPHAADSDDEINKLLEKLKVFKEDEFAKLLHDCHNIIRNREKLDPAAAFDEIAKILFLKAYVERELKEKRHHRNIFTVEFLNDQIGDDPLNDLFENTKRFYAADRIFARDTRINLKPATGKEIVAKLQRYNLSDTSEDVKGIAFERFLGRTFRGEIGQFFTPRPIVEFMIRMIDPKEGDVLCDPASGSGGFLIRFFEIVRQQIMANADREYQTFKTEVEAKPISEAKRARLLREKWDSIQPTLDQRRKDSRLWNLANRCIFGTDANDRMARTSKMNMIMHGDGHGGVHHHDGFINVNGIFEGRFDIVLTNPPFGANVESMKGAEAHEAGDVVRASDGNVSPEDERRYREEYGKLYVEAQARVQAAIGKPIASLFELPKKGQSKIKTEILFLERCLALLKPGGRLGIVLPEGVFNNPSLAYVREFCEDRAFIRAVVSLPQETFYSSGASVKASLLFMSKFTEEEQADFEAKRDEARAEVNAKYASEIETETQRLTAEVTAAEDAFSQARKAKDKDAENQARARRKAAQKDLSDYLKAMEVKKAAETRALLKEKFAYPIFMYEAEKVGISATGEADLNELYPNDKPPPNLENACLELYQQFRVDPEAFFVTGPGE